MGAVPSRETLQRGLYQLPDYGQRHRIVLIPLTKSFFPSADCLLLRQLFDARCDPFVRYYHAYDEHFRQTEQDSAAGAVEDDVTHTAERNGWRADAFPSMECTLEEFYEAYVCRAGESLLFDTDEEMMSAHAKRPHRLRPVPCAVAFAYNREPATAHMDRGKQGASGGLPHPPEDAEGGEPGSTVPLELNHTYSSPTSDTPALNESVEICGWYVQAVGFVGDVNALRVDVLGDDLFESDYQLQIFMNKSVGDHNSMHVLFTAIYTYVAQWRGAVMAGKRGDAGALLPTMIQREQEKEHSSFPGDKNWSMPPMRSVSMLSRRANVPMLCFQRGVRAMLIGMGFSKEVKSNSYNLGSSGGEGGMRVGGGAGDDASRRTSNYTASGRVEAASTGAETEGEANMRYLDQIAAEDLMITWVKNDYVFAQLSEDVASCSVRYVVECICRHEHPLDSLRARRMLLQRSEGADATNIQRSPLRTDGSGQDTTSSPTSVQNMDEPVSERAIRAARSMGIAGIAVPQLREESVVVEEWPEEGMDLTALVNSADANTHFYWVIGNSEAARVSAAAAFAAWEASGWPVDVDNSSNQIISAGDTATPPMMAIGESLHLLALPRKADEEETVRKELPHTQRVLRRGFFPLEELLLAELHNACKWAREADVYAENWVRVKDAEQPPASVRLTPAPDGAVDGSTPALAAAVARLVGDGPLCLWRVPLSTGAVRVVAVTPQFARPPRKKRVRRRPAHRPLNAEPKVGTTTPQTATKPIAVTVQPATATVDPCSHASLSLPTALPVPELPSPTSVDPCTTAIPVPDGRHFFQPSGPSHLQVQEKQQEQQRRQERQNQLQFQQQQQQQQPHHHHHHPRYATPPPPPLRHNQYILQYHSRTISDGIRVSFRGSNVDAGTSPRLSLCSRGTKDDHCEVKSGDDASGSFHRRTHTEGCYFSPLMPTPPPTWDSGAAFWQHSAPDDRLHGAPPSYYNARAQPQLSSSPPQSITTFPRLTAFDQRCFGPPWGADQSASSCCESGRMSPSTTRFQDPQCSIPLIPDGDRIDEDGYSNTGIHVTVRHGLPHYRTPSSINYSDTASNQEAPATRVSPAGTSMQRHVRTGTFHWDWKKSEQQEYKDVL